MYQVSEVGFGWADSEVLEVGYDWLDGIGLGRTASLFEYMLVGVEFGGYSMFDNFHPLFSSNSYDEITSRLLVLRHEDEEFGYSYAYEIWRVVDGKPSWLYQMELAEGLRQLRYALGYPDYDDVWAKVDEISSECAEWDASHPDLLGHLRSVCQSGPDALVELGDMAD